MSTPNRRRYARIRATAVAAHLQTDRGITSCFVENISNGGLFIRTSELLPVGMAISLSLARRGMKRPLRLTGRIASALGPSLAGPLGVAPGLGVQFDAFDSDTSSRLSQLIRELGLPPIASDHARAAPRLPPPVLRPVAAAQALPGPAQLMIEIRGAIGDLEAKLSDHSRELTRLREEVDGLKTAVRKRDELLRRMAKALSAAAQRSR